MSTAPIAQGPVDINVMGWLPIETAPHDGTVIELLGENGKIDIGEWHEWSEHFDKTATEIAEGVTGEFSTEYGEGPHTHWRPLPPNEPLNRPAEGQSDSNALLCTICGVPHRWAWTDTHGVAQCLACGTPYTIYHYDERNVRLDKPPEIEVKPEYIPVLRAYWNETHRRIPGGCSFPGGQELATPEDIASFSVWMEANAEKYLGHNAAVEARR